MERETKAVVEGHDKEHLGDNSRLFGQVYSRREKQTVIQYEPNPNTFLEKPSSEAELTGKEEVNDVKMKLPIVVRKGVRSYTQHPISIYVFYSKLSINYICFIFSLSSCKFFRCIEEAKKNTT